MGSDLEAVHSGPWLAMHEAIHDVKELLNALVDAHLLPSFHNPLMLPAPSITCYGQVIIYMQAGLPPHMKQTGLQKVRNWLLCRNSSVDHSSRRVVLVGSVAVQAWALARKDSTCIWFHHYQPDSCPLVPRSTTQDVAQTARTEKCSAQKQCMATNTGTDFMLERA